MTLEQFVKSNHVDMLQDLTDIVNDLRSTLRSNAENIPPDDHDYDDDIHIDIRLCVDTANNDQGYTWLFRTGDSSYDQRHSEYCGASCVSFDTEPAELLKELVNQLGE